MIEHLVCRVRGTVSTPKLNSHKCPNAKPTNKEEDGGGLGQERRVWRWARAVKVGREGCNGGGGGCEGGRWAVKVEVEVEREGWSRRGRWRRMTVVVVVVVQKDDEEEVREMVLQQ
ncbi:hypothetical protein QVD17_10347 [Tagetes erecta]|uniref:Uncharacterized protein n=1 Tax=Tagetes erecta TaxID=13708 RepID=A0AAD8L7R4_TARER|nr:hypothetical protein QVD17_10347 [Tagetes erecta]